MEAGADWREVPFHGKDRQVHQGGESDEAELRKLYGQGSCDVEEQLDRLHEYLSGVSRTRQL
eukprot:6641929-Heterocapsa_arctica.AAC.1